MRPASAVWSRTATADARPVRAARFRVGIAADFLRDLATRFPLDLTRVVATGHSAGGHLARFMVAVPRFETAVKQLLGAGTDADVARHMKEGSPAELLPLGGPQIFINGDHDPSVPIEVVQEYPSKARAAGDSVRVISVAGGHFESVDPALQPAGGLIVDSVLSLLGVRSQRDRVDDD